MSVTVQNNSCHCPLFKSRTIATLSGALLLVRFYLGTHPGSLSMASTISHKIATVMSFCFVDGFFLLLLFESIA